MKSSGAFSNPKTCAVRSSITARWSAPNCVPSRRAILEAVYQNPIALAVTLVWGARDGALSARVAMNSALDAGCDVDFRPLAGVGHFVSLEAADKLAIELRRMLGGK